MFAFKYIFSQLYKLLKTDNGFEFLKLMALHGSKKRFVKKQITFQNKTFEVPDCLSFIFQFKEIFVDQYYYFETANKQPIIIDCGANIGMSCTYFNKIQPQAKIYAFEADPNISQILGKNLTNNGIQNVEIISKAVWKNTDGIEFAIEGSDGASIYGNGEKIKVESARLRDFILKFDKIDMLKMDIEGAEYEVIKDCRNDLKHVDNIFIEYHSYPNQKQNLGEILEILTENGFRYFINSQVDRPKPLVNHRYKNNDLMDLQLNIFGYKNN